MTKTVPVSFPPTGRTTDSSKGAGDSMIEHHRTAEPSELEDNVTLQEGGDAGTKGTGSAG